MTKQKPIIIRASMLDNYGDCGLRVMVNYFPWMFKQAGYTPKERRQNIGAGVGQGVHAGSCHALKQVMAGEMVNDSDCKEVAIAAYREEVKDGVSFDEVTPRGPIESPHVYAERVIFKLYKSWLSTEGYKVRPVLAEKQLQATLNDSFWLEGKLDQYNKPAHLLDIKTGKQMRFHPLQLWGYSTVLKANNYPVTLLSTVFIKRVSKDKDAEKPVIHTYESSDIEAIGWAQTERIMRDIELFKQTRKPLSFPINPSSFLCDAKYCTAYNTDICPVSKIKGKQ